MSGLAIRTFWNRWVSEAVLRTMYEPRFFPHISPRTDLVTTLRGADPVRAPPAS